MNEGGSVAVPRSNWHSWHSCQYFARTSGAYSSQADQSGRDVGSPLEQAGKNDGPFPHRQA